MISILANSDDARYEPGRFMSATDLHSVTIALDEQNAKGRTVIKGTIVTNRLCGVGFLIFSPA